MQAQDYLMAKWAVGIRLPNSTDEMIERALNDAEILRTHVLRPTWHFVSADDLYWLLDLTAPRILSAMKFREKWLGLTGAVVAKSNRVIERALSPDAHLTREELITELNKEGIRTDEYRSGHLLMRAELDGVICSGRKKGGKQTYALLEKRVTRRKIPSREESLKRLAQRYFSGHAPATVQDFSWWSGLSLTDSRNALEMVQSKLTAEMINGKTVWFPASRGHGRSFSRTKNKSFVVLLPAYDEFLIGYRDRSATLEFAFEKKSISNNGIFRPTILINGQVTGLWTRTMKKDSLEVRTKLFRIHTKKEKSQIRQAVENLGSFMGAKAAVCTMNS